MTGTNEAPTVVVGAYRNAVDNDTFAPLIDVTDAPLTEMLAAGDSVLARSVQRLVHSLDDPDGIISAFQSYASS